MGVTAYLEPAKSTEMQHAQVKISRVIARLNIGGPAIQAVLLTDAFRKRGYISDLLVGEVPAGEASMEYLAHKKGIQPIRIASMSRNLSWWRDLTALIRLIAFFRRERPFIVHTHTAKAGALGRLAAILTGVPARVHTFHGHVFHGYFAPSLTKVFIWIERFLALHTDRIIAISESQRHDLVDVYRIAPKGKVVVVPLGLELDQLLSPRTAGDFRASIGCPASVPLVAWIGRLTGIKDPALFVDSAASIQSYGADVRFTMVGDGELREQLKARSCSFPALNLAIVGSKTELPQIYADSDLIVLTSVNEGTPVVLIEAMAAGKPFVATDVGGVRDLMVGSPLRQGNFEVFENGILCDRNSESIVSAVCYLLTAPDLRKKMGDAGRSFVLKKFSAGRLADDLEHLYLELLREKSRQ